MGLSGARAAIKRLLFVLIGKIEVFWNVTSSKSTIEQSFERDVLRDKKPPPAGGEQGTSPVEGAPEKARPPETPPAEEVVLRRALVPERHRSKEHQEGRQYRNKRQGTPAWKWRHTRRKGDSTITC